MEAAKGKYRNPHIRNVTFASNGRRSKGMKWPLKTAFFLTKFENVFWNIQVAGSPQRPLDSHDD